jgi:hypothetical protein
MTSTHPFEAEALGERHPIYLAVHDDLRRSRLTVFVRPLLAAPHYAWLTTWSIAALFAAAAQWLVVLTTGRPEGRLHGFLTRYLRYSTHFQAYLFLIGNPYPHFVGEPGGYPVDLAVDPPAPQRRWKTALRIALAIPPSVFASVLAQVLEIVALLAWFAAIALGRVPKGMRDLAAYCLRYEQQTVGYLLLLTDRYPSIAAEAPREGRRDADCASGRAGVLVSSSSTSGSGSRRLP